MNPPWETPELTSLTSKSASEMTILEGTYYEEHSSKATQVSVSLSQDGLLTIAGDGVSRAEALSACTLSEPLGTMARHFSLPDGARVEITDIDALAAWERGQGRFSLMQAVHQVESRWLWVAAFCSFLLALMAAMYVWALPWAAKWTAFKMPPSVAAAASGQAMEMITRMPGFDDSELPAERREAITAEFLKMAAAMHRGQPRDYRLRFFSSPMPNAFALPDGLVCMTDSLVKKAGSDLEIFGVLAHEIVHVREQHGMRSALQNSAVFLIWTLMTGDVSSLAGMGSALPAVLAQSGYSRGFEQEADLGAADYMIQRGWGVKPLCDILLKIDPESGALGQATEAMSSHPLTEKRALKLREHEQAAGR